MRYINVRMLLFIILLLVISLAESKTIHADAQDEDGSLITQRKIGSKAPLVGINYADNDKAVTFIIDNLQSATLKTIYYIIKHYAYKL